MPADLDELARRFPGSFTTSSFRDNDRVVLSADQSAAVLLDLLRCLKHDCGFDFLAETLGLPRRAVVVRRGDTGRKKLLRIEGLTLAEARARLGG